MEKDVNINKNSFNFLIGKRICAGFLTIYICTVVGGQIILKGKVGMPLNSLIPPPFCVCPKPDSLFLIPYVVVFLSVKMCCCESSLIVLLILVTIHV